MNSSSNETNPFSPFQEPPQLITFRRVTFALVIVLALFGNLIVIRAIRSKSRSRKPLTHYLVTCLAVAEILNSFFMIFYFVETELWYWPFGAFLCHIVLPGVVITFSVTTATLVCISVHRYRVLVTPYKKTPSKKTCLIIVGAIWVYSTAFSTPVIVGATHFSKDGINYCYPIPILPTYHLVRLICQFFIPVLIMFVTYGVASFKIREHMTFIEKKRQTRINSNLSTLNTYLESQGNGVDQNLLSVPPSQPVIHLQAMSRQDSLCQARRSFELPLTLPDRNASMSADDESSHMIETERDIIKMFYVIVLVFLVCYIPYQVCFILDHFAIVTVHSSPYYQLIRRYVFLLTTFPSALHPLCYGTMSKFYATAFSKMILCKW